MEDRIKERGVLISVSVDINGKSVKKDLGSSGSGFVADSSRSIVVTSANWMRSALSLRLREGAVGTPSSSHLHWVATPGTKFVVHSRSRDRTRLETRTATIALVSLMPEVFCTMRDLWLGVPLAVDHTPKSRDDHVDEPLQSLLYPSSVVVLKCAPDVFDR